MQERKQLFRAGDQFIALFPKDAVKAFPIVFTDLWTAAAGAGWAGSDLNTKLSAALNDAAYLVDNGSIMNVVSHTMTAEKVTDAIVRWAVSQAGKIVVKELTVVASNATLVEYAIADTQSGGASILMTGYQIAGAYSAVVPTDTIIQAIAKVEAGVTELKTQVGSEDSGLEKLLKDFIATKAQANGLASLDANGKVPASQLPSFVDDVVNVTFVKNEAAIPTTGLLIDQKFYAKDVKKIFVATSETDHGTAQNPETDKIYIDLTANGQYGSNKTYRWSGTDMVEISSSLALGETAQTAYAGNKGKANRDALVSAPAKMVSSVDEFTAGADSVTMNFKEAAKSADGFGWDAEAASTKALPVVSETAAGVMSANDKKNLDVLIELAGGDPTDPSAPLDPTTADFLKKTNAGVGVLADYAVATDKADVTAGDTISVAVGKLQKQLDDVEAGTTSPVVPEIPTVTVPDVPSDVIDTPFPEADKPAAGDDLKTIIAKQQAQIEYLTKQIEAITALVQPDGYDLVYVNK